MPIATATQHTYNLECANIFATDLKLLTLGNLHFSSTIKSLKYNYIFYTDLNDILFLIGDLLTFGLLLRNTIKPYTFLVLISLANKTIKSLLALPIHLLLPFIFHLPSFNYSHLVSILLASDPIYYSVNPQPPIISNVLIFGNTNFFYSSEPKSSIVLPANIVYTK